MIDRIDSRIARLTYPVDFPGVPPVNVYALLDAEPVLIDCGPDGPVEPLLRDLAELGVDDVRHLIVTHGHVDHFGLARRLREIWPLTIYVHEADIPKCVLSDDDRPPLADELKKTILSWGVPEEALRAIEGRILDVLRLGPPLERRHITPMGTLPSGLQARHCPGHTEGLVCLSLGDRLFSSDHLLQEITPNPSLYLPPYRGWRTGLRDYLQSLRGLDYATVLPGHGAPFADAAGRAEAIERACDERRAAILGLLDGRGLSVMQITANLWSGLDPLAFFLGGREVHGHLEILESRGRVRREKNLFFKAESCPTP
jgi:glyoxylase-like metal-dependent hydrolase (beta-lactamase superfamily II)